MEQRETMEAASCFPLSSLCFLYKSVAVWHKNAVILLMVLSGLFRKPALQAVTDNQLIEKSCIKLKYIVLSIYQLYTQTLDRICGL